MPTKTRRVPAVKPKKWNGLKASALVSQARSCGMTTLAIISTIGATDRTLLVWSANLDACVSRRKCEGLDRLLARVAELRASSR